MNTEAWHRLFDHAVRLADRIQDDPAQRHNAAAQTLAGCVLTLAESYGGARTTEGANA